MKRLFTTAALALALRRPDLRRRRQAGEIHRHHDRRRLQRLQKNRARFVHQNGRQQDRDQGRSQGRGTDGHLRVRQCQTDQRTKLSKRSAKPPRNSRSWPWPPTERHGAPPRHSVDAHFLSAADARLSIRRRSCSPDKPQSPFDFTTLHITPILPHEHSPITSSPPPSPWPPPSPCRLTAADFPKGSPKFERATAARSPKPKSPANRSSSSFPPPGAARASR